MLKNPRSKVAKAWNQKQKMKITKVVAVPKMKDTTRAGVLAIVRKMLDKKVQDKRVGFAVETNVSHNSAIGPADCRPLLGQIGPIDSAAGNNDQQRLGDKIRPKSLRVRGILALHPDNQTSTQTLLVRVLLLAQKDIKVGSTITAGNVDTSHLLSPDYNTAPGDDQIQYVGATANTFQPINTDKFRVYYDKVFKLCPTTNATVQNDMNVIRWSHTFKKDALPASFTYDAGNGDWANNFAPFLAIGYSYADGSSPDVIITKVKSHCDAYLTFEDA